MATYAELYDLRTDSAIKNRVITACIIAAETIMLELDTVENHANRLLWAKDVFANPAAEANRMYMAILAANNTLTVAQIQAATDAGIQTNVDDHVNLFADGS